MSKKKYKIVFIFLLSQFFLGCSSLPTEEVSYLAVYPDSSSWEVLRNKTKFWFVESYIEILPRMEARFYKNDVKIDITAAESLLERGIQKEKLTDEIIIQLRIIVDYGVVSIQDPTFIVKAINSNVEESVKPVNNNSKNLIFTREDRRHSSWYFMYFAIDRKYASGFKLTFPTINIDSEPVSLGSITFKPASGRGVPHGYKLVDVYRGKISSPSLPRELRGLQYAKAALGRNDPQAAYRLVEDGLISENSEVREKYLEFIQEHPEVLASAIHTFSVISFQISIEKHDYRAREIEEHRLSIFRTVASREAYEKARQNFDIVFGAKEN